VSLVLQLPDGALREVEPGATAREVAAAIGPRLLRDALVARVGDRLVDLSRPLGEVVPDGRVAFALLTLHDADGLAVYRHTATHVMAQAVRRLYPGTHLAIGPVIADGFYYDMDVRRADGQPVSLTADDLPSIEAEMARIVAADYPVQREVWDREEARARFAAAGEQFKVEIIEGLPPDAEVTVYRQGEFFDLCRGPHLPSTGRLRAFKLLSVAGAYWRGDERRPMLQRLYGTAFPSEAELKHYLWVQEEAKRRDHRRLGPELGLFLLKEEAPGFPFWLPRGWTIYRLLEAWSRELQQAAGYREVQTPVLLRNELWERSGHWELFRDNMFTLQRDDEQFALKPMNCPAHCLLFASETRSYRDLPLRLSEYQQLARYERSGSLHGLLRVRGMHQDDAHLFVTPEQIGAEMRGVLALVDAVYGTLGMPYEIRLATRPERFLGDPAAWERAEADLGEAVRAAGRTFTLSPGEGAFYGPKLEFHVTDALGRRWQCATVQLDWNLPERFDLWYVGPDGARHRPVMIHRAIMGSLERFVGILVEHFAGAFPSWLAPVQALVLPIADRHAAYAHHVAEALGAEGLRAEVDAREEKIARRIREAQLRQVPYMLVVGDREAQQGTVSVRSRRGGDLGSEDVAAFAAALRQEVAERALEPRGPAAAAPSGDG
jgi:threonyl-tRNA synthetase